MKQIKKLSLSNMISKLTRNEMRYVMAGSGGGGSTTCYGSSKVCYTDAAGTKYTCSGPAQPESEADCCCGHSSGDDTNCVMG